VTLHGNVPKRKQIPSDFFRKGDNVRGIENVEFSAEISRKLLCLELQVFALVFQRKKFWCLMVLTMVKKMKFEFHEKKSRFYDDRIDPKLLVWV
jgi:hypothetical protein